MEKKRCRLFINQPLNVPVSPRSVTPGTTRSLHRTNTVVKKFKTALEQHDVEAVHPLLREATSALHRAVTKGALHRNTASRRISQLSTQFNALKAQ